MSNRFLAGYDTPSSIVVALPTHHHMHGAEYLELRRNLVTADLATNGDALPLEPIPPFSKCATLLVFVAQSTSHRCKSYVGFLFSVSMGLYAPKNTKMASFFSNAHFNHQAHTSSALAV